MERSLTSTSDSRPCVANYSTEGGFWTGKQFKTYEDFPTVDKNTAFDKLAAHITSTDYQQQQRTRHTQCFDSSYSVYPFDSENRSVKYRSTEYES